MSTFRETITVTGATGGAGVATATANSSKIINGLVTGVYLEYIGAPPAGTTDVVIVEANNDPAMAILTLTNSATDGWKAPVHAAVDVTDGVALGPGMFVAVNDYIKVTITGANDDDGVTATIVYVQ